MSEETIVEVLQFIGYCMVFAMVLVIGGILIAALWGYLAKKIRGMRPEKEYEFVRISFPILCQYEIRRLWDNLQNCRRQCHTLQRFLFWEHLKTLTTAAGDITEGIHITMVVSGSETAYLDIGVPGEDDDGVWKETRAAELARSGAFGDMNDPASGIKILTNKEYKRNEQSN